MVNVNIQDKTKAEVGTVEKYWFENKHIGLKKTLFHVITIPLTPFDSGFEYEQQTVTTQVVIDWLDLQLNNPDNLDGVEVNPRNRGKTEATIYLGSAHNWCDINKLTMKALSENKYQIDCELLIDFEHERVAQNEAFRFQTTIDYLGERESLFEIRD